MNHGLEDKTNVFSTTKISKSNAAVVNEVFPINFGPAIAIDAMQVGFFAINGIFGKKVGKKVGVCGPQRFGRRLFGNWGS